MASFGVHVERTVGLLDRRPVMQVHSNAVRFECPKISDKLRVPVERPVRLVHVGTVVHFTWRSELQMFDEKCLKQAAQDFVSVEPDY